MSRQHVSLERFTAIVLEVLVDIASLELQAVLPVLVGPERAQVFSHSAGSAHLKSGEAEVALGSPDAPGPKVVQGPQVAQGLGRSGALGLSGGLPTSEGPGGRVQGLLRAWLWSIEVGVCGRRQKILGMVILRDG